MTSSAMPFVSILVPVKNEQQHIEKCIKSLLAQNYPKDLYEILIMDNMSEDETPKIAETMGVPVHFSASSPIGKIRNELLYIAKGEIIAYIDGDCSAPPSWLNESVKLLLDDEVGAVGGYISRPDNSNWLVSGWALEKSSEIRITDRLATGSFFSTKKVLSSVGGFNEFLSAGEDTDISRRILAKRKKLLRAPSASVVHWGYPSTVSSFLKRQIWQTSDYLESRKAGFDAVFYATSLAVLAFFCGLLMSLLGIYKAAVLMAVVFLCIPAALAWFRISKSSEKGSIITTGKVYAVSILYLVGRGVGLSISILRYLSGRYRTK